MVLNHDGPFCESNISGLNDCQVHSKLLTEKRLRLCFPLVEVGQGCWIDEDGLQRRALVTCASVLSSKSTLLCPTLWRWTGPCKHFSFGTQAFSNEGPAVTLPGYRVRRHLPRSSLLRDHLVWAPSSPVQMSSCTLRLLSPPARLLHTSSSLPSVQFLLLLTVPLQRVWIPALGEAGRRLLLGICFLIVSSPSAERQEPSLPLLFFIKVFFCL